jgi:DNA-binding Xre family transcriptional regulator
MHSNKQKIIRIMSKLKSILKDRRISQVELVEMTKEFCKTPVPRYTINKICNGSRVNYSIVTLMKICRALEVTPNEILSKADYDHIFKKS